MEEKEMRNGCRTEAVGGFVVEAVKQGMVLKGRRRWLREMDEVMG